ncbi:MAG: M90 family metallopeptidase [Pseudomonadota bacterium]
MIWLAALVLLALGYAVFRVRNARKARETLLSSTLTDAERAIIAENVALYNRMPLKLRAGLEGKIRLFLDQVDFYGAGGLDVDDDMALCIAAQACILVAANDAWFPTLRSVILYPGAFKSKRAEQDGFVVTERETVRIGESWARGPVILSWADSARGAFIDDDGHNVVFHEFAHQLDDLSGATNGLPQMASSAEARAWAEAFNEAFERANRLLEIGKRPFLDAYGATAPEELFAVAVEAFFETPIELLREEPALYRALSKYFQQDPASWGG